MPQNTKKINFNPKHLTTKITSNISQRSFDVIKNRFGLAKDLTRNTLHSIGKKYGITRERVRQIQEAAINSIKESEAYQKEKAAFEEIKELVNSLGFVLLENDLHSIYGKDELAKNHIKFHLTVSDVFKKHKKDDHFNEHWITDHETIRKVHEALKELYAELKDDELIPETEMIKRFLNNLEGVAEQYKNDEIAKRWLSLSHRITRNPIGEWGKFDSPNIRMKGVKDYAFLVLKAHGSPLHFREVAEIINKKFNKKVNVATCHNELIKDNRFALVGRGLYALSSWGYKTGSVRKLIQDLIKERGPMTKTEISAEILKDKHLKVNTVYVNLCNSKYFKRHEDGRYGLV